MATTAWTARAGPAARLGAYLAEMHPPLPRLGMAVLLHAGFTTLLARAHGMKPAPLSAWTALGVWSVFAAMLMLRLMDELKDADLDRVLFPARPLPSGRVREGDIVAALVGVIALFVVAHARTPAWPTALAVLAYALLMFRWFFVPAIMRPRLLFTLATHQPFVPLMLLHLAAIFAAQHGLGATDLRIARVAAAAVVYWSALLGWELSRKIRAPEQEDAYVTYSRRLGARGAVAFAAGAQGVGVAAGLWLWRTAGLGPLMPAVLAAGWLIALAGDARFLVRPGRDTSWLRPYAEACFVAACVAGIVA